MGAIEGSGPGPTGSQLESETGRQADRQQDPSAWWASPSPLPGPAVVLWSPETTSSWVDAGQGQGGHLSGYFSVHFPLIC